MLRRPRTGRLLGPDGQVVCERCVRAAGPLSRMKGLLGRRDLPRDEGLLLVPASSVHTAFMAFPIDVVFLDRELRVLAVRPELRPFRFAGAKGARRVLELAAGRADELGLEPGAILRFEPYTAADYEGSGRKK